MPGYMPQPCIRAIGATDGVEAGEGEDDALRRAQARTSTEYASTEYDCSYYLLLVLTSTRTYVYACSYRRSVTNSSQYWLVAASTS